MLYVAIGSLWVVSIICMLFLAAYIYQLTRRQLDAGSNSYFWTVLRILIVFCLGLSIFYFGVANRVESLPKLVAYRLQVREIPLWSPEAWVSLSLALGVCAVLFAVTDTLKNDFNIHQESRLRVRSFKLPILPLTIPYGLQLANRRDSRAIESNAAPYFSQSEQFWALANVLVGLFTGCFLFVGLQTISQVNFVQALGIQGEFTPRTAFNQRVRPTPTTATIAFDGLALPQDDQQTEQQAETSNAAASGVAQAPLEVAARSGLGSETEPVEPSSEVSAESTRQPSSAPSSVQPIADTSVVDAAAVDPPSTESASIDAQAPSNAEATANNSTSTGQSTPVVLINEPLGVNARTGPGTAFNVITVLQNGTQHVLLQRSDDGQWLNIQLAGAGEGWVAAWVVDVSP